MPSDTMFRLSIYLTLALSCASIGYAEWEVLPEVTSVAVGAIAALAILFRLETRVELLSIPAAQRLGLVIGVTNLIWVVCRLLWEKHHNEFQNLTWVLLVAAMFGMLLISLMPAKLARREKHGGDYLSLHGMALVGVCLAGAIAEDPICFALIVLYAIAAVWSLSLFHLRQAGGAIPPAPGAHLATPVGAVISGSRPRLGLRRFAGFIAVTAAIALPLYLITPRSNADKLSFGQSRVEIGYAADQMTDLNQTGELKANDTVAFEVEAEVEGQPMRVLPPEQRWRGRIHLTYSSGVWRSGLGEALPAIEPKPLDILPWSPPRLGQPQYTFTFSVPSRKSSGFLADPIIWAEGQPAPIAELTPAGPQGWKWNLDGTFRYSDYKKNDPITEPRRYMQVWHPEKDPELSPAFHLISYRSTESLSHLRNNPVPRVKDYADAVIKDLIALGQLPANCLDPIHLLPRPEYQDRIAREFCLHLSTSPQFRYTTSLRRDLKNIDPIEEFLFHSRSGHCERFATALALMLRSQGIPSVLVLGFKGSEATDVPGKFLVKDEHAHAWVAALVPAEERIGSDRRPLFHWRTLDPTPGGSAEIDRTAVDQWTQPTVSWLRTQFRKYISGYSAEERQRALKGFVNLVTSAGFLGTLCTVVAAVGLLRLWLRRGAKSRPEQFPREEWFARLIAHLNRCGFTSQPGETAREFAARIGESLRKNPETAAVAEVPLDCTEAYYETRFGGKTLEANQLENLQAELQELIRATSRHGRKP